MPTIETNANHVERISNGIRNYAGKALFCGAAVTLPHARAHAEMRVANALLGA